MTAGTTRRAVHAMMVLLLLFSSMAKFANVCLNEGFDFLRIDLTGTIVINLQQNNRNRRRYFIHIFIKYSKPSIDHLPSARPYAKYPCSHPW